MVFFSKNNFVL